MNLLGRLADPSFWSTVRTDAYYAPYIKELKESWDELCEGKPLEPLYYHDYKLFNLTGDRGTYERPYFRRRGAMNAAAILSLIYPEEEKYFAKLQDAIFDICNEYTWCLPAHLHHTDKGDPSEIVDLFAAETGFSLAEIYVLHEQRLDDLIKKLIRDNIERRVINPSFDRPEGWWWEHMNNNWLSVCAGSVGCTAMLMYPDAFRQLKLRFDRAMERYIDSFLGEGMCLEGCAYWDYGFGFFTIYADMLKSFTEGKEDYFERDDVKAIAAFPQRMVLTGGAVVSFSDMGSSYLNSVGIIHYLKSVYPDTVKLPNKDYCTYGIKRWRTSYILRAVSWAIKEYSDIDEIGNTPEYFYAEKSQWYINKTANYAFAAKGGTNQEPHNHNDVGTFIFAREGRQIFTDLGSGLYSKDYFSSKRYEIFEPSSFSHSLPIFNGEGQKFGEEYQAKDVCADESSFTLDIAAAYGNDKVKRIVRRFDLLEDGIKLTDKFDLSPDCETVERFVVHQEPAVLAEGIIEVDGAKLTYGKEVKSVSIEKKTSEKNECFVIDLTLARGTAEFTAEIK